MFQPRFLQLVNYPNQKHPENSVIVCNDDTEREYYLQFPEIFREMAWYELRKKEEMPEFVKFTQAPDSPVLFLEDYDDEDYRFKFRDFSFPYLDNIGQPECWIWVKLDSRFAPVWDKGA